MTHPATPPKFIYFDLGRVLINFDIERMCRQMAQVAHLDPARVREILFSGTLHQRYEVGQITTAAYYEQFCSQAGCRPSYDELLLAACDIFDLNTSVVPIVAHLWQAGYRLGILSNTCECHWEYCWKRYRLLREVFSVRVLSYEVDSIKPEPDIFQTAARMAGVPPEAIFFTDDIAGHIAGARAVGFDAVQYTSTPQLAAALRERGIRFNY